METTSPSDRFRQSLSEGEEFQWVVQPHPLALFLRSLVVVLLVGVIGGGMVAVATTVFLMPVLGGMMSAAIAGGVALLLVLVLLVSQPLLYFFFGRTEYAATNQRLIKHKDGFSRTFSSVPLAGVQDAEYEIGMIENALDIGTVTLNTASGYESMSFSSTFAPAEFTREVNELASRGETDGPTRRYTPSEEFDRTEPAGDLPGNLYPDEELLWVTQPNKTAMLSNQLFGRVLALPAVGILFLFVFSTVETTTHSVAIATAVSGLVGFLLLFLLLKSMVVRWLFGTRQYAATDRRLLVYEDRLGKRLDSLPLVGVQDAEYSTTSITDRFGVGTVTVDTDLGYEELSLSYVNSPVAVAKDLTHLANSNPIYSETSHPREVTVNDGIEPESPSTDLQENIPDDEQINWVLTPDEKAKLLSAVVQLLTLSTTPGTVLKAARRFAVDRTEYALTESRLVEYSGTFGRELEGVPLDGIQDAEYDIEFVERQFGVGDVTVDTDRTYESITLEAIANPADVAREISEVANAYRFSAVETMGDATTSDETVTASTETQATTDPSDVPAAPAQKRCRDCSSTIDVASSFCPACGEKQPQPSRSSSVTCRSCDGPVDAGDAFCRYCGTDDPAGEHGAG